MRGYPSHPWGNYMDRGDPPGEYVPPKRDYPNLATIATAIIDRRISDGTYDLTSWRNGFDFDPADLEGVGYVVGGVMGQVETWGGYASRAEEVSKVLGYLVTARKYIELRSTTGDVWADLPEPRVYIGIWTDPETGKRHLDVSEHFMDEALAFALARARAQLAVWDVKQDSARTP